MDVPMRAEYSRERAVRRSYRDRQAAHSRSPSRRPSTLQAVRRWVRPAFRRTSTWVVRWRRQTRLHAGRPFGRRAGNTDARGAWTRTLRDDPAGRRPVRRRRDVTTSQRPFSTASPSAPMTWTNSRHDTHYTCCSYVAVVCHIYGHGFTERFLCCGATCGVLCKVGNR